MHSSHILMSLILQVIQTVVQEAPPKPTTHRGVGNYDVTVEYLTEAEAYHTLAEKVQLIREKEIQSWRQGMMIPHYTDFLEAVVFSIIYTMSYYSYRALSIASDVKSIRAISGTTVCHLGLIDW